ncbi:hypothetical protein [Clostridium chrysemydis]|uniref:hypothetical protein n=1 Tax=Clostridium chrysemydis TaxID=2665504 RepID=UPI001883F374|nr:hypothetical protein [Clostridium chrysemydis]
MKIYGYNEIFQIKKELEDIVKKINEGNDSSLINIANEMKKYIVAYDALLNKIGRFGTVNDLSLIKGLTETEMLIKKTKNKL